MSHPLNKSEGRNPPKDKVNRWLLLSMLGLAIPAAQTTITPFRSVPRPIPEEHGVRWFPDDKQDGVTMEATSIPGTVWSGGSISGFSQNGPACFGSLFPSGGLRTADLSSFDLLALNLPEYSSVFPDAAAFEAIGSETEGPMFSPISVAGLDSPRPAPDVESPSLDETLRHLVGSEKRGVDLIDITAGLK